MLFRSVTIGVRAEHIQINSRAFDVTADANAVARAAIERIERLSDEYLMHLRLHGSDQTLIASAKPGQIAQPGEDIHIHISHSLHFDADGHRVRA